MLKKHFLLLPMDELLNIFVETMIFTGLQDTFYMIWQILFCNYVKVFAINLMHLCWSRGLTDPIALNNSVGDLKPFTNILCHSVHSRSLPVLLRLHRALLIRASSLPSRLWWLFGSVSFRNRFVTRLQTVFLILWYLLISRYLLLKQFEK